MKIPTSDVHYTVDSKLKVSPWFIWPIFSSFNILLKTARPYMDSGEPDFAIQRDAEPEKSFSKECIDYLGLVTGHDRLETLTKGANVIFRLQNSPKMTERKSYIGSCNVVWRCMPLVGSERARDPYCMEKSSTAREPSSSTHFVSMESW